MLRRKFISNTVTMSMSALLPVKYINTMAYNYKLGIQLFSVNRDMNRDPIETLKAIKTMGYEDCEVYGFDPDNVSFYGIPGMDLKNRMSEIGLTASSGHFGFASYFDQSDDKMKQFVDRCISGAKTLELSYITWPFLNPAHRSKENFYLLANKLNAIGKQVTDAGLKFAYHNHGFEFENYNGINGYEIILQETDPDVVKLQMDLYWVMHSSLQTPKEIIAKQPGRYVMWHIKDMDKVTRDYTELGNGSIDYMTIMPDPKISGLEYYYLEQGGNFAFSALKSAADSALYFKKNLMKFF